MNFSCGSGNLAVYLFISQYQVLFIWNDNVFDEELHNFVPLLGLIIDAFGELRDQQEQVKEDMEVRVTKISFHIDA